MISSTPLTSIIIPAYKSRFFAQALDSALAQTWPSLEIVVCDDSADDEIENMVEARASCTGVPIRYFRNQERAGEQGSTLRGIRAANGVYVKFLHDDDILEPDCVAALVAAMQSNPRLSLASSRRRRIGPLGRWLPDIGATSQLFSHDVVIDGPGLVSFLAEHTVNFIGEPSCVLCRRKDLLELNDDLMSLAGKPIHWVGDLALYAKLLRRGDLALLAAPLTRFRVSALQFSQLGRDLPGIGEQGHVDFRNGIRSLGWHHPSEGEGSNQLLIAALGTDQDQYPVDMRLRLEQVFADARTGLTLHDWQTTRAYTPGMAALFDTTTVPFSQLGIIVDITDGCDVDELLNTLTELPLPEALRHRVHFKVIGGPIPRSLRQLFPAQSCPADHNPITALNSAISAWDVDWVLKLDAGTDLCVGGLTKLLWTLAHTTAAQQAISVDEWLRDAGGQLAPILRPAFDVDLLMANPGTFSRHWVFRRNAVVSAGGFDPDTGGAAELAMLLHIYRDRSPHAFVRLAEPLLLSAPHRTETEAAQKVVSDHLRSSGFSGAEVSSPAPGLLHIAYGAAPPVLTSIIIVIAADTNIAMLERCVVSIIEKTSAPYELLLIDNGSPAATGHWIGQVEALGQGQIHAYSLQPPLARAAANNVGASKANGHYLLFLRPETAVLQTQWLDALLDQAQRPGVGVVGALTVSGDGLITHAGLVPGCVSNGGRVFAGQNMAAEGYLQRLQVAQRYAAVSDSCLSISREHFDALNGFDHSVFDDEGADVDLCLRAKASGLATIWTPHARLLHSLENAAMKPSVQDLLFERWLPEIADDNAYNPNLRLDVDGGFRLGETDFSWKPLPWKPLPRLLAQPADPWGSGQYRVIQPFKALKQDTRVEGALYSTLLDPVEQARIDPDVVILQRRVSEDDLHKIQRGARFSRALKVYELDDYLPNLPPKSAHREHMPRDVLRSLRKAMGLVDRFVVSTPAMAEAFAGMHPDIRIARNRLPVSWWKYLPTVCRADNRRPRVGWAGGLGHTGDLEMIADVVSELAREVDWVFFGMCPDRLRPYVAEFHPGVDIALYPRALAQLQLDLAIAPLEENRFNACKSNLRLLEYGACAVPVVCSDVGPYRDPALPVTRVRNRHREWVGAIREHLADADARRQAGEALKAVVHRDWMLEGAGLDEWRAAWLP